MTIMYEVRQKISNHPVLTDLERDVVVLIKFVWLKKTHN